MDTRLIRTDNYLLSNHLAPYRGLDERYCISQFNHLSTIYKEGNAMIEIRETANGTEIYVDGYYVGKMNEDGTAE